MECACGCGQDAGIGARGPNRWLRGHHNRSRGYEAECSVNGCDRKPESRGLCHGHAEQLRRTGVWPTQAFVKLTRAERFWAKVEKTDSCWLWRGATAGEGRYGVFRGEERNVPAHRFAYELEHGPIADGLDIDHLCRVTLCVRPSHLEAVTHRTNVLRGEAPSARNATKTHCKHGHPLSGDNLVLLKGGGRYCRTCARAQARKNTRSYRERKKAG